MTILSDCGGNSFLKTSYLISLKVMKYIMFLIGFLEGYVDVLDIIFQNNWVDCIV